MKLSWPKLASSATKFAVVMFWLWNVLFICATLPLGKELPELLRGEWSAFIPVDYLVIVLVWMVMPWLCLVLGATVLRGRPQTTAFLFLAVEGPFFALCLYRLMVMRELTPAVAQWLVMAVFGLAVLGFDALVRPLPKTALGHGLRLSATVCGALVSLYVGALALLGLSPLALRGGWELLNPVNWARFFSSVLDSPWNLVVVPIGLVLLLTFACWLAMPLYMVVMSRRACVQAWEGALSRGARVMVVSTLLVTLGGVFGWLNHQPQRATLEALVDQQVSLAQFQKYQSQWRAGLLNAYLAPYRYASSEGESQGIADLYVDALGVPRDWAQAPQWLFNRLAKPVLYDGENMQVDADRAAALYEKYFDAPIQKGEREAILKALSATYDRDQRESGLINVDQRKVRVTDQRIQVKADGDLATITLDETYLNLTHEPQEIFYLFSLPEDAAITGLWLGLSPQNMLPHVLATRGAAQRVYKAEVNRNIDPALLEQVGPRQYRLRAFPVPAKPWRDGSDEPPAPKLYLRLQYTTLMSEGAWPLPVLAEKRNVAFDGDTQRRCAGAQCPARWTTWWPGVLKASQLAAPQAHAFDLTGQGGWVSAQPSAEPAPRLSAQRVNLIIDRSASMAPHRSALRAALQSARQTLAGHKVSVLLTTTAVMPDKPRWIALEQLQDGMIETFMGGGRVGDLLAQADTSDAPQADLTVVLTDEGAFDLDVQKTAPQRLHGMLSFIHVGGVLAPVYDDNTLQAVQASGGSSFTDWAAAWDHFARSTKADSGFVMARQGYTFQVHPPVPAVGASDPHFAPIAARLRVAYGARGVLKPSVKQLDAAHAVAQAHQVVTPYSSMLVLVNDAQKDALAKAEAADDRFDRAPETGSETLSKPHNPLSAAPEPEEWLLIIMSLGGLGWMLWARRRAAWRLSPSRHA